MERITPKASGYSLVSLFSGIGGLDLGFEYAGVNCIWANDFDKFAVKTYRANVGDQIVEGDIRLVKDQIPPHDILIGGFPCQPFSTLGKLKGFDDEKRGTMFFEVLSIIKKCSPKVVVLENVKNLKTHDGGRTLERIESELDKAGYYVNVDILNSQNFGVPQRRNRVFIVAFRKDCFKQVPFKYPKGEPSVITTQDLLDKDVDKKYFLTPKIAETILAKGTKGYIVNPTIDLPISKTLTATMHKMHRASQDNYVTDNQSWKQEWDGERLNVRKLTPNECRQLQGFPSSWTQVCSDAQAYKQFGNAVTVNVAYAVAVNVLEHMSRNMIHKK